MNYLELVQEFVGETGEPLPGPTSLTQPTADIADAMRWIRQAYVDIQLRPRMRWLQRRFNFQTTAGVDRYAYGAVTDEILAAPIDRFTGWLFDPQTTVPGIYLTSAGVGSRRWLNVIEWDYFSELYRNTAQPDGQPIYITVDPQNCIVLGPKPSAAYTVYGEYQRGAQRLSAAADVPEMPENYHSLIVYLAMVKYGFNHLAQEVLSRADRESRRMMRQLDLAQGPRLTFGPPLA